jgi:hypothetical protein
VELPGQYRDQITGVVAGLTVPESDVTSLRVQAPNWAIGAVRHYLRQLVIMSADSAISSISPVTGLDFGSSGL